MARMLCWYFCLLVSFVPKISSLPFRTHISPPQSLSHMPNVPYFQHFDGTRWKKSHQIKLTTRLTSTSLHMSSNTDPFSILNIPKATTDRQIIKKAYRRMAMKYHPDVVISSTSTPEEKKKASDYFATINAAYEMLMGKGSNSQSQSSQDSNSAGYTPPHRRASNYGASSNRRNNNWGATKNSEGVDWQDFMPDSEDDMYNTDGDSFASIFSDFVTGVTGSSSGVGVNSSAGGGAGILRDLVEFLEKNVDGFSSGNYNEFDPTIQDLLQYGTLQEVKEELDDTELLVQQLQKKLSDLSTEQQTLQELNKPINQQGATSSFVQKMEREERLEEISARKKVVEGYLTKAKGRMLRLQTKYKELRSYQREDSYNSSSSYQNQKKENDSATWQYINNQEKSEFRNPSPKQTKDGESWKKEGFGSSGRGRGRKRRTTQPSNSSTYQDKNGESSSSSPTKPYNKQTSPSSAPPSKRTKEAFDDFRINVAKLQSTPPHRRGSSQKNTVAENKKRLRELQIEDEFEKLKKELGM